MPLLKPTSLLTQKKQASTCLLALCVAWRRYHAHLVRPSVQDFAHVRVYSLPPHAVSDELTCPHWWHREALHPHKPARRTDARNTRMHIPDAGLRVAPKNRKRLLGSTASPLFSREKHRYIERMLENNDVSCLQETHGHIEFLQALSVLHTQFHMLGTFYPRPGQRATLIRETLPHGDTAVLTHVVIHQVRDQLANIHSENGSLTIAYVHLESESNLRNLRERQQRISTH